MSRKVIAFVMITLLWIPIANAAIDAMELAISQPYQSKLLLQWDSVVGGPFSIDQQRNKTQAFSDDYFHWRQQTMRFKPGQQQRFLIPAYESLRLYHPDQQLRAQSINAYLSNGSGLLAAASVYTSQDGHSLIVSPQSALPVIVTIQAAEQNQQEQNQQQQNIAELDLAVLVSRRASLSRLAPYPDLKWLSGQRVWLSDAAFEMPELFWIIQPYQQQSIVLTGPARIELKHRLRYEPQAAELLQDYRISYQMDNATPHWLELTTGAESSRQMMVNNQPQTLGRQQSAYLEIPSGRHRLQLVTDRILYFQLLEQSENDYLLPTLNQPPISVQEVRENTLLDQQALIAANGLAQTLVRDNQPQSAALVGQQILRQAAFQRMDYPRGLAEAEALLGQRTFYRNLLPTVKQSKGNQFNAYFVKKQLKAISKPQQDAVLADQHQAAALKRLGNADFSPLAPTPTPTRYKLPQRSVQTWIRMIADQRQCTNRHFYVQMDQQPAQKFLLRCEQDANTGYTFVKSLSEAALLNLQTQLGSTENSTLSHLFSAYRKPARIISVAINDLLLPAEVRELTVWSDEHPQAVNLALQIRAAKPYRLPELSYLVRLHGLSKTRLFNLLVADLTNKQQQTSATEQQLINQWLPLKRYLSGLYRHYKSSVAEQIPVKRPATPARHQQWQQQAQRAEQQQQWTTALSAWNRIVEGSEGQMRDHAQLAQANILVRLSENYLADSLLRYLTLYAQADIAELAKQQLFELYTRQHDDGAIQTLAAAMFIQRPNQSSLQFLIQTLMQNAHYRFALLMGQTFAEKPPVEQMLKAAYHLHWWQTYQELCNQLPKQQQLLWAGLKAQQQADYQSAVEAWNDTDAGDWLEHLQQGLNIRQRLPVNPLELNKLQQTNQQQLNDTLNSHDQLIIQHYQDWSAWQQKHPGEMQWEDANALVKDAAGTDQYYAEERDLSSRAFRSTQQRPVTLQVMGPVKLSFLVRLLHQHSDAKLDGWLQITDNSEQFSYPFSNNKPVHGLVLTGEGEYLLGNLFNLDYQVGQGLHEIKLFSADAPVSVSISRQVPELALTVLAPLQIDTFSHAVGSSNVTESQLKQLIPKTASTSMAIANKGLSLQGLLGLPNVVDANQAASRMMQYLAVIERETDSRQALIVLAEQLQRQFPDHPTVQSLWNRVGRYSEWQSVHSIVSNAGLRFINTSGWQPSSPMLGVRKALITESNSNQHVVFSDQRLLMVMRNLEPKKIRVEALLDDLVFLPDNPAILQYQIDSRKPRQIAIRRSNGWKKLVLRVPVGQHQIRFSLLKPVANQFLKLRVAETAGDIQVTQERNFFVSTRLNPLQVNIHGPASIRIDEWLHDKIVSRYQTVAAGWQLLTIPPAPHQQESLLQIKQRIATDQAVAVKSREIERLIEPVLPLYTQLNSIPMFAERSIENTLENSLNAIPSGFGTWSLGTDLVRRNNVQEDTSGSGPIHFQQLRVNHRYFDEFSNTYWNSQGFVRLREFGSPSYGLQESIRIQPQDWPLTLNINAKLITQQVDNEQEWMGQLRIALSHTAHLTPKTRVVPGLSWFGRYMSLRNSGKFFQDGSFKNETLIKKVDQDLYTAYKSQHTTGMAASLLFIHQPWLDTRWTAKINSVSNENQNLFIPDHVSTEAHWQQLMGDIDLDAGVRVNFYQKDNDRASSSRRHFTKLKVNWQAWTKKQNRLEISGLYNFDIDRNEHLGMLSFTYHFGGNRGYRDFKPGEINFRQIRERQKLDAIN